MPDIPEDKVPVIEKRVVSETGNEFIVEKSPLIKDSETKEKFITITISSKMLHFLHAGLGKYKEGFKGQGETNRKEREQVEKIVDELTEIKAILNEEVIDKKIGKVEPNPVTTEPKPNDPT